MVSITATTTINWVTCVLWLTITFMPYTDAGR